MTTMLYFFVSVLFYLKKTKQKESYFGPFLLQTGLIF